MHWVHLGTQGAERFHFISNPHPSKTVANVCKKKNTNRTSEVRIFGSKAARNSNFDIEFFKITYLSSYENWNFNVLSSSSEFGTSFFLIEMQKLTIRWRKIGQAECGIIAAIAHHRCNGVWIEWGLRKTEIRWKICRKEGNGRNSTQKRDEKKRSDESVNAAQRPLAFWGNFKFDAVCFTFLFFRILLFLVNRSEKHPQTRRIRTSI